MLFSVSVANCELEDLIYVQGCDFKSICNTPYRKFGMRATENGQPAQQTFPQHKKYKTNNQKTTTYTLSQKNITYGAFSYSHYI